jgi:leishmanolysin
MHEMYHAFGFSNSAFKYYVDATGKPLGINNVVAKVNNINYIIMPEVKKLAANYFNCATVNGGTLENEGGSGSAGSHWERVTFGNEAMTASEFDDSVFSIFTLKLMKGTGWYLPNEDRA